MEKSNSWGVLKAGEQVPLVQALCVGLSPPAAFPVLLRWQEPFVPWHTPGTILALLCPPSVLCQSWQCLSCHLPLQTGLFLCVPCRSNPQIPRTPKLEHVQVGIGEGIAPVPAEQTAPPLTCGSLALSTFDKLIPFPVKPSSLLLTSLCFAHSQPREIPTRSHLK